MIHISKSLEETTEIAKGFLSNIAKNGESKTVAFYGDLGAGKTTFIQALAKEMGIEEPTTSPTFVIQKSYKPTLKLDQFGQAKYFDTLIHIDAYRLESGEELSKLRFEETLKLPKTLICIEWPSNVESVLPKDAIKVECRFVDETTREYNF
jgi:tRNA threonylcarbamoyladenosine biosynthesis protein TsaE